MVESRNTGKKVINLLSQSSFDILKTVRSHKTLLYYAMELCQWGNPLLAFAFFALFGFTAQKRAMYKCIFWNILKPFGVSPRERSKENISEVVFAHNPRSESDPGLEVYATRQSDTA